MKSTKFIWDPKYWKITLQGYTKNSDIIYRLIVGEGEDYPTYYDIEVFMSRINYERILSGKYRIEKRPYDLEPIIIYDKYDCEVPLVNKNTHQKVKKLKRI